MGVRQRAPGHGVRLPAYWIDTVPASNAAYRSIAMAGGYDDPRWVASRRLDVALHVRRAGALLLLREGGRWRRRRFARVETLPAEEPVQQVCWYDADAYARLVGERLPTEAERGVIMHFPR